MISNTHTITIGRSKNGISRIVAISFSPEKKILTLFYVIAMKTVDIAFKKIFVPTNISSLIA